MFTIQVARKHLFSGRDYSLPEAPQIQALAKQLSKGILATSLAHYIGSRKLPRSRLLDPVVKSLSLGA